ncbi:hypothetical protein H0H92_004180 [Tricholoma furcatifolium]|nr:hypothetical protein H0H92_004180 [Tricholoma furcatifolium]
MADMDMLEAMGISGFGKATKKKQLDPSRFDKNKRTESIVKPPASPTSSESTPGPYQHPSQSQAAESHSSTLALPPRTQKAGPQEEPEYEQSDREDIGDDESQFPITHEILLKDHTKVVSALALDPSGARIVSGSHDYDCKLWDFGGMDMRCKPFKSWEPAGTYYVHDLKYSNDGQKFLVVSGTTQIKLFDRDGEEQIWDVEHKRKQKTVISVKSKDRGARTKITTCGYSTDGKLIGGVCLDGAFHMWQTSSNFVRPNMSIEGAHNKGTETGSMTFSVDGRTVLTRGGDDTVKLWDLRAFKKPLATRSDLTTLYPNTNAMFSPDEKYIITGSGATSKGGKGKLMFLERNNLEVAKTLEVDSTPVKVFWHSKINQIVTGLSNGQIVVLYSPLTSLNGAKLLANKGPPRKVTIEDMSDALAAPSIITPHALPMFRDMDPGRGTKRKAEKDRLDPRKSRRPELPVTGPGKGGRVGASATQHIVQHLVRDTTRDEDPREALLKYAEKGENDPQWTAAWKINQPKPVFAQVTQEEEETEE